MPGYVEAIHVTDADLREFSGRGGLRASILEDGEIGTGDPVSAA